MAGFLDRFRRFAPPGAALPGGAVPVDPQVERAAELEPVFRAAAALNREAEQIRAAAREQAAGIGARSAAENAALLASAAVDAARVRDEARTRTRAEQASRRTRLLDEATARATAIRQAADHEHDRLVTDIVAAVRALGVPARP